MIVLDTHTLIWWAAGDHAALSPVALKAIDAELNGGEIVVSPGRIFNGPNRLSCMKAYPLPG